MFIKNNFRKNHLVWNFNFFGDCTSIMRHWSISDCTMIKEEVRDFVVICCRNILGDITGLYWQEAQSSSHTYRRHVSVCFKSDGRKKQLKHVMRLKSPERSFKIRSKNNSVVLICVQWLNLSHMLKNSNTRNDWCTDYPILCTPLTTA